MQKIDPTNAGTYRENIVAEIISRHTEEEQAEYYKLLDEYDAAFKATTKAYSIENNTVTGDKEELYSLFKIVDLASKRLRENKIADTIINDSRIVKFKSYEDKIYEAHTVPDEIPYNPEEPAEGVLRASDIESIVNDICQYEDQLLKELEKHPRKYHNMSIDELITKELINADNTKKEDGLFWALLGTIKRTPKKQPQGDPDSLPRIFHNPLLDYDIVTISEKGIKTVEYPLDKINNSIWTSLLTADKDGQLTMFFDTMKQGAEPQPLVLYSIDFSALEDASIIKKLTAYDKRVYIAVNGLYAAGYDVISINQIYSVITNKRTKPNKNDRDKINKSLSKMTARLHLDNSKELNDTYAKYPRFKYDGALLPFDRVEAELNGNYAEAIRIYRPASEGTNPDRALPLVKFAKQRGQYTTITSQVFGALSLTDSNLEIEDYLIEQIGHIKRGTINPKMLYKTICEASHQTTQKQQSRAKGKITDLLDHFVETGFIKSYKKEPDGIIISYERPKNKTPHKKK